LSYASLDRIGGTIDPWCPAGNGTRSTDYEVFSPRSCDLLRRAWNSTTAAAAATLREPTRPAIGIRTR